MAHAWVAAGAAGAGAGAGAPLLGYVTPPKKDLLEKVRSGTPPKPQFVISAHGGQVKHVWPVPPRISLHFFTQPGADLFCDKVDQTKVCTGEKKGTFSYHGPNVGQPYQPENCMQYNYLLRPDTENVKTVGFHSGVVLCPNTPILYMRYIEQPIWLSDLVNNIIHFCDLAGYPHTQRIHITCLFCRGDLPEGYAPPAADTCPVPGTLATPSTGVALGGIVTGYRPGGYQRPPPGGAAAGAPGSAAAAGAPGGPYQRPPGTGGPYKKPGGHSGGKRKTRRRHKKRRSTKRRPRN